MRVRDVGRRGKERRRGGREGRRKGRSKERRKIDHFIVSELHGMANKEHIGMGPDSLK